MDPCLPPPPHGLPRRPGQRLAHHVGRHLHRAHHPAASLHSPPAMTCGKSFAAGQPGGLAASPLGSLPAHAARKAVFLAGAGSAVATVAMSAALLHAALHLPSSGQHAAPQASESASASAWAPGAGWQNPFAPAQPAPHGLSPAAGPPIAVPEPGTAGLFALATVLAISLRRRNAARQAVPAARGRPG